MKRAFVLGIFALVFLSSFAVFVRAGDIYALSTDRNYNGELGIDDLKYWKEGYDINFIHPATLLYVVDKFGSSGTIGCEKNPCVDIPYYSNDSFKVNMFGQFLFENVESVNLGGGSILTGHIITGFQIENGYLPKEDIKPKDKLAETLDRLRNLLDNPTTIILPSKKISPEEQKKRADETKDFEDKQSPLRDLSRMSKDELNNLDNAERKKMGDTTNKIKENFNKGKVNEILKEAGYTNKEDQEYYLDYIGVASKYAYQHSGAPNLDDFLNSFESSIKEYVKNFPNGVSGKNPYANKDGSINYEMVDAVEQAFRDNQDLLNQLIESASKIQIINNIEQAREAEKRELESIETPYGDPRERYPPIISEKENFPLDPVDQAVRELLPPVSFPINPDKNLR